MGVNNNLRAIMIRFILDLLYVTVTLRSLCGESFEFKTTYFGNSNQEFSFLDGTIIVDDNFVISKSAQWNVILSVRNPWAQFSSLFFPTFIIDITQYSTLGDLAKKLQKSLISYTSREVMGIEFIENYYHVVSENSPIRADVSDTTMM